MFHYKGREMKVASSNTDLHGYGEAIRAELGRRVPRERRLRVLDVGTGFGINVAFLAGRLARGSTLWTVDPSEEVIEAVRASLGPEVARRVRFAVASADHLGFEGGYFDAVVSVMVLHHLEALQPALREMERVLRPGGRMVLVDYKPEASRELEFKTLHEERDFFTPEAVAEGLAELGLRPRANDQGLWYLVEARKARLPPPRGGKRAGRGRRGGGAG